MNYFSSDAFLETLAEVFFPGRPASRELFRVEGSVYRLLVVDGRPITHWWFLDLLEPVETVPVDASVKPLGYLPQVLRGVLPVEVWRGAPKDAGLGVCPFVDWSTFPTWEAYQAAMADRGRSADSRRMRRVLERELGPIEFVAEDSRPEVLAACIQWKSAQFRATGFADMFRNPLNARFYEALLERKALAVSSLSAGDRLVAVHVGMRDGPRRLLWMPAYDAAFAKAGPGRLLTEALLEHSYRTGDREFDFLAGDEPYKLNYATHVRLCGPVGREPLMLQANRAARKQLKRALRHVPWLEARVHELGRRLEERA